MFSAPKPPKPPAPPPAGPSFDEDIEAAGLAERRRRALAGGRASTILFGPQGELAPAPVQKKSLLGS
jgi:hypothetical protein